MLFVVVVFEFVLFVGCFWVVAFSVFLCCQNIYPYVVNELYLSLVPRHGLQSRPPSPKRAERKVRRRPFREAGSGQNNGTR